MNYVLRGGGRSLTQRLAGAKWGIWLEGAWIGGLYRVRGCWNLTVQLRAVIKVKKIAVDFPPQWILRVTFSFELIKIQYAFNLLKCVFIASTQIEWFLFEWLICCVFVWYAHIQISCFYSFSYFSHFAVAVSSWFWIQSFAFWPRRSHQSHNRCVGENPSWGIKACRSSTAIQPTINQTDRISFFLFRLSAINFLSTDSVSVIECV